MTKVKCIKSYHDIGLSRSIEIGEILYFDVERANLLNALKFIEVIVELDQVEPPQDKALNPTYKKK